MTGQSELLTQREIEVLHVLADTSSSLRQVASQLHVSYSTIKWYTRQIYGKLDVTSREEAVKKAWGIGLLEAATEIPNNLPAAMSPFIGRIEELEKLTSLILDPHHRLVTILATGGMGKTAFALEAARQITKPRTQPEQFADGIYFASLASIEDAEYVLATLASAIGFVFEQGPNPRQQLLDHLHDKDLLLILDNFEHVLDATPIVIDVLQTAPDVSILVTSRERLNLNAETIYPLPGLSIPDRDSSDDLLQYDAINLFLQTARRIRYDFVPSTDEIDLINHVCHLTNGMPLAIILAAVWFDSLSLQEIADEIERNLDMLHTDMGDIPQRLRGIRAVFEAVWQRLSANEQDVFLRMSVFRGGCTKEAAEHVTSAPSHLLQSLVNKALLTKTDTGRFQIHELLRQYAEERLEQVPELYQSTRDKHCDHYAELISAWGWWSYDQDSYAGMKTTAETDWDNVTRAWLWAGHRAFNERLWELSYPLACVSWHRGWFQEAASLHWDVIQSLESHEAADVDPLLQASLSASHAYLCNYLDQAQQVEASATMSLAYLGKVGEHSNQPEMAAILKALAMDLRHMRPVLASNLAQQLIESCRSQGKVSKLVWAYFEWAMTEFAVLGNIEESKPVIEEALEMAKQQDIVNLVTAFTHLLAAIHYQEGQLELAKHEASAALEAARSVGDQVNSVTPLVLLGDIALKDGNLAEARDHYHRALIGFDRITRKPRFILSLFAGIADLYAAEKRYVRATELASFVRTHPFHHAYWSPHKRAEELLGNLEGKLAADIYKTASAHGSSLDADSVFDQQLTSLL